MSITQIFNNITQKIKKSFLLAWNGKEKMFNILFWWGILSFIICYLLIQPLIDFNPIKFIDILISGAIVTYYIWHIIVIRRCSPKKPKLTKEQEKKLKQEKRKEFPKRFMRKLFLKEPITKWNPPLMIIVVDLYIIIIYVSSVLYKS